MSKRNVFLIYVSIAAFIFGCVTIGLGLGLVLGLIVMTFVFEDLEKNGKDGKKFSFRTKKKIVPETKKDDEYMLPGSEYRLPGSDYKPYSILESAGLKN